ncbi:transmembrane protein 186 isoform X1 [Lycorma delicatula]|uniref:transmembrane protein 186 isoform X1 n=1 Tax=Lycorma delicatula TaxID=130591 RepID=UPI003F51AC09
MLWRLMCVVKFKPCVPGHIYSLTGDLKCKLYKNAPKLARSVNTNVVRLQNKSSTAHKEEENDFITIYSCHLNLNKESIMNKFNWNQRPAVVIINIEHYFYVMKRQPSIKYLALFNKSIWLPSVVLTTALPVSTLLHVSGFITMERYTSISFLAIWLLSLIHLVAMNFWRRVGFLYVNKNIDKIKISYISYWGKRKDIIIPVSEVMTFSDMPRSPFDIFYRKVKIFNSKPLEFNSYKLDLKSATITKPDVFFKVFGSE